MTLGSIWAGAAGLALQAPPPGEPPAPQTWGDLWKLGGLGWIYAVNLIIWTGLFLYLLRLDSRLRSTEKEP